MPRGRVGQAAEKALREEPEFVPDPPKVRKKTEFQAHRRSLGNGPACPDGDHGNLYDWQYSKYAWYCSHSEHGGNGKLFTAQEVP